MIEAGKDIGIPEKRPRKPSERLFIWATNVLSRDCRDISDKMGCEVETVVDKILYIGDEAMKAFADGKKRAVVTLVDGKIVVESFRE